MFRSVYHAVPPPPTTPPHYPPVPSNLSFLLPPLCRARSFLPDHPYGTHRPDPTPPERATKPLHEVTLRRVHVPHPPFISRSPLTPDTPSYPPPPTRHRTFLVPPAGSLQFPKLPSFRSPFVCVTFYPAPPSFIQSRSLMRVGSRHLFYTTTPPRKLRFRLPPDLSQTTSPRPPVHLPRRRRPRHDLVDTYPLCLPPPRSHDPGDVPRPLKQPPIPPLARPPYYPPQTPARIPSADLRCIDEHRAPSLPTSSAANTDVSSFFFFCRFYFLCFWFPRQQWALLDGTFPVPLLFPLSPLWSPNNKKSRTQSIFTSR